MILVACATAIAGCGLTLDYGPPDPQRSDAGRLDAGRHDAGQRDAGIDGGGPCRTQLDCTDHDACNGLELCVDGACVSGDPVVCPDDDVCDGVAMCDPGTGRCLSQEPMACAMDSDPCNGIEICDPVLGCTSMPPPSCDDGVACTTDFCTAGACGHSGDDTLCTAAAGGACREDGCVYPSCVEGVTCVADNPCLVASCATGTCVRTPVTCATGQECCAGACVPLDCSDGQSCTDDGCDMALGCTHLAHGRSCDDGDACTTGERCLAGHCVGGSPRLCANADTCNAGLCDASTGGCTTTPLTGVPCFDGNACTVGDTCMTGTCVPGTLPARCEDFEPCTTDGCTPGTGCSNDPLPDDTACTTIMGIAGACSAGVCRSRCSTGTDDCDGDGSCECIGTCAGGACAGMASCATLGCTTGQTCCTAPGVNLGRCFDSACGTCCH